MVVLPAGNSERGVEPSSEGVFEPGRSLRRRFKFGPSQNRCRRGFLRPRPLHTGHYGKSFRIDHLVFIPPDAQETATIRQWAPNGTASEWPAPAQQAALRGSKQRDQRLLQAEGLLGLRVQQ